MTTPSFSLDPEAERLRRENFALIERFMRLEGPNRNIGRAPLLHDDGFAVMAFTQSGTPHKTPLPLWNQRTVEHFPVWGYPRFEIFMTQYPDRFWGDVTCRGAFGDGEVSDGQMYTYYECTDGKISLYMEMYNPIVEAPTVGQEQKAR
ncbi:MAG: PhzA/PhzB family protein [Microbacterium sp.]